jgi:hypothetical protein
MNKTFEYLLAPKLGVAQMIGVRTGALESASDTASSAGIGVKSRDSRKKSGSFYLCATFALCAAIAAPAPSLAASLKTVNLGSAAPFAVLSYSGVTNSDSRPDRTVITGDLGVYPTAGTSITGFSGENAASNCCGIVRGIIEDTGSGEPGTETTGAKHGQASLTIAIHDAAGRPCTPCTLENGADLGGRTLTPGLYKSTSTISITNKLYLKGKGVYIFQIATGLIVNVGAQIVLENGAEAADIFWQVGSAATLGSGVIFEGSILAGTSVTMGANTTVIGRALASTGNVTLISDTVTLPR